jgi:hypothetical protein
MPVAENGGKKKGRNFPDAGVAAGLSCECLH